jgi:dipeptidyl aminopeptidase/acylaminoacyl peptidase
MTSTSSAGNQLVALLIAATLLGGAPGHARAAAPGAAESGSSARGTAPAASSAGAGPAAAATAPATTPTPPRDPIALLGRLPSGEDVALSPDGTRLAFVRTDGDERLLAVWSLTDGRALTVIRLGDVKLRAVRWADGDRLLLTTSVTYAPIELQGGRREWFMLQVCAVNGRCTPYDFGVPNTTTLNVVAGPPEVRQVDGRTVVHVTGFVLSSPRFLPALFAMDLGTGRSRIVHRGVRGTDDFVIDAQGRVVAELRYSEEDRRYSLAVRIAPDAPWVAARADAAPTWLETPSLLGLGPDGASVVVRAVEDGVERTRVVSLADGAWSEPFPADAARGHAIVHRLSGRVLGFGSVRKAQYWFADPDLQRRMDSIARAFRDGHARLAGASDDFSRIAVLADQPDVAYAYHVVDWSTKRADLLGEVYEGLGTYAARRAVVYRAADGLEIPAYLTLPRGREPKNLPLVVLPHGGPATVDTADFDWWSQAFAARGYAVLQPNFRGSTVSVAHLAAGFGEWGRKMQTDVSDGVRWLAEQGTVDARRVCVVGASYGGYVALAGVTLEQGVYRCAASVAGVSDLNAMLRWVDFERSRGDRRTMRWWQRFMGATGPDDPTLATISPARFAARADAPVLLVHGRDDTVVPFAQSERMADALRDAGRPVEFVALKREDHWLSRSETRLQMLQTVVAFVERHNPP